MVVIIITSFLFVFVLMLGCDNEWRENGGFTVSERWDGVVLVYE